MKTTAQGVRLDAPVESARLPLTPARYDVQITHRRRDPLEYGFGQRSSTWLVDLDALPRLPVGLRWLASFRVADHRDAAASGTTASLRHEVERFLVEQGVPTPPATILMLANPRLLGYVFNPLSVFYCYDAAGRLTHEIAEVRNTYGGRHSYLLTPDEAGSAHTDKVFYVSPFYPTEGRYTMRMPEPGADLLVSVTLHRDGERPFAAVMTGNRASARAATLWSVLRSPLATRAVMFGIKRHGIRLYLKGLRPFPRSAPAEATTGSAQEEAR
ncbi:MAG: hypothetical protein JWN95_2494 [Frankiales bacterium]|nr:hypothetical protein [Frankiales bacterium]